MSDNCDLFLRHNTDITGIGVRLAFYLQVNLLGKHIIRWITRDTALTEFSSHTCIVKVRGKCGVLLDSYFHELGAHGCWAIGRPKGRTIILQCCPNNRPSLVRITSLSTLSTVLNVLDVRLANSGVQMILLCSTKLSQNSFSGEGRLRDRILGSIYRFNQLLFYILSLILW